MNYESYIRVKRWFKINLIIDNSWTAIQFDNESEYAQEQIWATLRRKLAIRREGYLFSKAYKMGYWDGYSDEGLVDKENSRIPSGLTNQADEALGELQNTIQFTYTIFDNRPDQLLQLPDVPDNVVLKDGEVTLRDYQYESIVNTVDQRNGVWHLATNTGKTYSAIGLISVALDHLEPNETICVFTESKEIFNQFKKNIEEALNIPVGIITSQKKDTRKVNIAMTGTVGNAINIDVEEKVKLTPKERIIKRVAKLADNYGKNKVNQSILLKSFIQNYKVKYKTDEDFLDEVQSVLDKSESDAKIIFNLNGYRVKYNAILKEKNTENYKKKKKMTDFLDTVTLGIWDEAHHVTGKNYYDSVLGCNNALMRVGLTGSIDNNDPYLIQRLKAAFFGITNTVRNEEMIERGISAKPKVVFVPITKVLNEEGNEATEVYHSNNYMKAYDGGIVKNEYRNALIAKMTQQWYKKDKGILIVVNRIEQGKRVQNLLNQFDVPNTFIHGESEPELRSSALEEMKSGTLKVLIATNIIDEGVDINNIDVLFMAGGNKAYRQVMQRTGRVLRKKEGKENRALIIEFDDRTNKYLKKHSNERFEVYDSENFNIEILGE